MNKKVYTVIVGTGSYIPGKIITNDFFLDAEFYDPASNVKFEIPNSEIIRKFFEITMLTTEGEAFFAASIIACS